MELDEDEWSLSFDGASVENRSVGIVLTKTGGEWLILSYKLDFKVSNSEAEFESLILRLMAALNIASSRLC